MSRPEDGALEGKKHLLRRTLDQRLVD
jgi:hypothetical protein